MSLDEKLDAFDRNADEAVDYLIGWLVQHRRGLIALARGRHVEGHYRYADRLMYELSQDELKAEASQELGDAINYIALKLQREGATDGDAPARRAPV